MSYATQLSIKIGVNKNFKEKANHGILHCVTNTASNISYCLYPSKCVFIFPVEFFYCPLYFVSKAKMEYILIQKFPQS